MRFLFGLYFIFILGCTDAQTQVSRLFDFKGPEFEQSNLTISSITDLEIKGVCLPKFNRFELSLDNQNFNNVSSYLSSNQSQSTDCSNGYFVLLFDLSKFSIQNNQIIFYLRQISDKDYTAGSKLVIQYQTQSVSTPPSAIVSVPAQTNQNLSLVVSGGNDLSRYKFKIGDSSINCSDSSGYVESIISNPISFLSSNFSEGLIKLCLLGGNSTSFQNLSEASVYNWILDTTPPDNVSFSSLPNSADNRSSYSVGLSSNGSNQIYAKISPTDTCDNLSLYNLVGNNFSFDVGSYQNSKIWICAYSVDQAGNFSTIQKRSWDQDMTNPISPLITLHGSSVVSFSNRIPTLSISLPIQVSPQTELIFVQAKIINESSQDVVDWTNFSTSESIVFNSLNLNDGTYQILVRAIDLSGNIGAISSESWRVDTSGPLIVGKEIISQPYSLRDSPTFKVIFNDSSGIDIATARIVDDSSLEIKGEIPISSGVSFSFSGDLGLIKNNNYSVELFLKDSLGNIRTDSISFRSPNCVKEDPNNSSVIAGICEETSTDIKGFSMMGGVVLGTDPHDSSYILVVEGLNITSVIGNLFGAQTWGSTSLTSGNYEGSLTGATQTPPAFIKYDENPQMSLEVSGAMKTCADRSSNGLSDWFVPSIYQLTKFLCHSNYSSGANASNPSIDPNCATYGKSTTFTTLSASSFGSYTESSSTKYYSINPSILSILSAKSKTITSDFFCMRRFKKQYP